MSSARVPLYERLPEIYRTRDAEQTPPFPLRAYLGAIEAAFDALHADIGQLYENLFVDTCDDWVVPYLADLLGSSHLRGDPHTLRADVADTIALRRRKGTLGAIERLAFDLTGWTCRAVEMRENLAWTQHLNHQRPDAGGAPPFADPRRTRFDVPRGGTVPLRDPRTLALRGTPFDPFAVTPELRPPPADTRQVNLPNLAVFVWRLADYRLPLVRPLAKGAGDLGAPPPGQARFALRFELHPLDLPVRLFNHGRSGVLQAVVAAAQTSPLTAADAVPGPMIDARLTTDMSGAAPDAYVRVAYFDDGPPPTGFELGDAGLHLFLPASLQPLLLPADGGAWTWRFRGDNLCAWESGLRQPLASGEIAIDPDIGRVLIGLDTEAQRDRLIDATGAAAWYASFTYGAAGPVGAHPQTAPAAADDAQAELRVVGGFGGTRLQDALSGLDTAGAEVVVEIRDSFVHPLDLGALAGTGGDGTPALRLARGLTIRAGGGQRPVVLLARPLAFRPQDVAQPRLDTLAVRLQGLYLDADPATMGPAEPLVARAALGRLEIIGCTLAPGGHARRDGTRGPPRRALALGAGYGFTDPAEEAAFAPTPQLLVQRSICGALAIDERYALTVEQAIVDAAGGSTAIGPLAPAADAWGATFAFDGITCLGAVRTRQACGSGGLFPQRFEALDNQHGCIQQSWFGAGAHRLPAHRQCLFAPDARLVLTSARFNDPGYGQVARASDERIRTLGPGDDTMGAFGFMLEARRWINLQLRLREFMPVGVRPLVVPVT